MTLIKTIHHLRAQFPTPPSYLQLSIKLDSENAMNDLVNYYKRQCSALHLRLKDDNHLEYKNDILQFKLPNCVINLQHAGKFVGLNFTPPIDIAFSSIATNKRNKIVVLNVNHHFGDYEFFKFLIQNFYIKVVPKETPHFPRYSSDVFKKEISKSLDITSYYNDRNITRLTSFKKNDSIKLLPSNAFNIDFQNAYHSDGNNYNYTTNLIDQNNNQKKFLEEEEIIVPAEYYKSYNPIKNAPENLTEYLWLSHYFAASAFEGELFNNFKVKTLIDLRKYLKFQPDFEDCHHCSVVSPFIPSISYDDKLINIASILRNDLELKLNNKEHFSSFKAKIDQSKLINGIDLGVMGVGAFPVKRPIVDLHCSFLANATKIGDTKSYIGSLYLMSFSPQHSIDSDNPNDIVTKLIYNPNIMPLKDAGIYMRRVEHILTNVSLNQTVGEVFDEVKKIY